MYERKCLLLDLDYNQSWIMVQGDSFVFKHIHAWIKALLSTTCIQSRVGHCQCWNNVVGGQSVMTRAGRYLVLTLSSSLAFVPLMSNTVSTTDTFTLARSNSDLHTTATGYQRRWRLRSLRAHQATSIGEATQICKTTTSGWSITERRERRWRCSRNWSSWWCQFTRSGSGATTKVWCSRWA